MNQVISFLLNSFTVTLGNFSLPVPYWQAAALVALIFILILTMADFRRHYVHWSLKGGLVGIFFGFVLALILEGFLLVGGKTILTEVFGWQNPPKPLAQVLDSGKSQLIKVLGAQTQVTSVQNAITAVQSLNPNDLKTVKNILCGQ